MLKFNLEDWGNLGVKVFYVLTTLPKMWCSNRPLTGQRVENDGRMIKFVACIYLDQSVAIQSIKGY